MGGELACQLGNPRVRVVKRQLEQRAMAPRVVVRQLHALPRGAPRRRCRAGLVHTNQRIGLRPGAPIRPPRPSVAPCGYRHSSKPLRQPAGGSLHDLAVAQARALLRRAPVPDPAGQAYQPGIVSTHAAMRLEAKQVVQPCGQLRFRGWRIPYPGCVAQHRHRQAAADRNDARPVHHACCPACGARSPSQVRTATPPDGRAGAVPSPWRGAAHSPCCARTRPAATASVARTPQWQSARRCAA